MKILYIDPNSGKAGLTEHIDNVTGKVLIALGQAIEVTLPARGAPGWLEARLEQSKQLSKGPSAGDTVVPYAEHVEWAVKDRLTPTGSVSILRRFQFETCLFDQHTIQEHGFPEDCPQSIIQKYNALTSAPGEQAEAVDAARRKQAAHDLSIQGVRRW